MKSAAVLGCGPAGLMAAWAARSCGYEVALFSKDAEKSRLGGAQYLHSPIAGITDDVMRSHVQHLYVGDPVTYQKKVYGDKQVPFVSFGGESKQAAWNLQDCYDALWDFWSGRIEPAEIDSIWVDKHKYNFSVVLSTIPLNAICRCPTIHQFNTQKILISTDPSHHDPLPENTILWDGTINRSWYRASSIFGHHGTEWSVSTVVPPFPNLIKDSKPISNNCTCWASGNVALLGRRGAWRKGLLSDDAYYSAIHLLATS